MSDEQNWVYFYENWQIVLKYLDISLFQSESSMRKAVQGGLLVLQQLYVSNTRVRFPIYSFFSRSGYTEIKKFLTDSWYFKKGPLFAVVLCYSSGNIRHKTYKRKPRLGITGKHKVYTLNRVKHGTSESNMWNKPSN